MRWFVVFFSFCFIFSTSSVAQPKRPHQDTIAPNTPYSPDRYLSRGTPSGNSREPGSKANEDESSGAKIPSYNLCLGAFPPPYCNDRLPVR